MFLTFTKVFCSENSSRRLLRQTSTAARSKGKHLFIVNDYPPILGGQSAFLYHLCRALPAGEIVVLAPACGDTREFDRAQKFLIVRKPYLIKVPLLEKAIKIVLPFFWAWPIIRREPVTCLHCAHVLSTGFIGLVYKKLKGMDYVIYSHSADILEHCDNPLVRPWLQKILNGAKYVVASSRFTSGKLQELGVPVTKILISWPKINYQEFAGGVEYRSVLERYGLLGRRVILSVGRLVERKGYDRVISALPGILKTFPDVVYVIFGRGLYGQTLRSMVQDRKLTEAVRFIEGDDHDKKAFLSGCEIFVMVSREIRERGDTEGFGIVYLEAGACGKPVVAGDSGGVRDAVKDGETGLLVDPESPDAVAEAIRKLLSDRALAERLGSQGCARVRAEFDYRCGAAELDPIFKEPGHA